MNWEAIGAIGEVVGAMGVVVTLGYLAVQIRRSSRVAALTAGHTISSGIAEFFERLALDPELHSLWNRGINSPESLVETDRDRIDRLLVSFFARCSDAHRHSELDAKIAERFNHMARHYLRLSAVQAWWGRMSGVLHDANPDLAAYIVEQLKITEPGASPTA